MTWPLALLCVCCGIAWHALFVMMMSDNLYDAFRWTLIAGAVAGYYAGRFTIWSRQQRDGRESLLDVVVTYYLGVGVYYLCGIPILMLAGEGTLSITDIIPAFCFALTYVGFAATVFGLVLMPLCWLSRHIVWRVHTITHPSDPA